MIPSVTFVFHLAKLSHPSSKPLIEPATSFSSPIFRTHPDSYIFFINFYVHGIGPATGKCASILFTLFAGDYDNRLQRPFSKLIHIGIGDQRDPLNTLTQTIRADRDPANKRPTISTKTGISAIIFNNFIHQSKVFYENMRFLVYGASFL